MSDQSEFLDVSADEAIEPQDLPDGLFKFVVMRYSVERENNDKRTPYVLVTLKPIEVIEAEEDVDLEHVRSIRHKFYRTPAADPWNKAIVRDKFGIDVDGRTWGEIYEDMLAIEVEGEVKVDLRTSKKTNEQYGVPEIAKFLKVRG